MSFYAFITLVWRRSTRFCQYSFLLVALLKFPFFILAFLCRIFGVELVFSAAKVNKCHYEFVIVALNAAKELIILVFLISVSFVILPKRSESYSFSSYFINVKEDI